MLVFLKRWQKQGYVWFLKLSDAAIHNDVLKGLPFWISALTVGLVSVIFAETFQMLEALNARLLEDNPLLYFVICPFGLLVSWGLVFFVAPYASGSGIPQSIAAAHLPTDRHPLFQKLLSLRVALVKTISACFGVLGGAVIGREGPTIQISTSLFSYITSKMDKHFPHPDHRAIVAAGGGAGIAAAFNTPLGGVVFAIEELIETHLSKVRTSLLSAVIISGLIAQLLTGPYLYLGFPRLSKVTISMLPATIALGIATGFLGMWFGKALFWLVGWVRRKFSGRRGAYWALAIGLYLACCGYFLGVQMTGPGHRLIHHLLFEDMALSWYEPLLRLVNSLLSYSVGGAGGIFAPALTTGASLGAWFSDIFGLEVHRNLFILLGMIGFLTGITRAPFTSFVLVLEMTDRHSAIHAMMTVGLVSYAVSRFLEPKSFYERMWEAIFVSGTEPRPAPAPAGSSTPPTGGRPSPG